MKSVLKIVFGAIFVSMICVTTIAMIDRDMFEAGSDLWKFWWFRATLADAYFGFITFFAWVAFKERSWLKKLLWFVLIMVFGNIAMSLYVLIELFRLKGDEPLANLLVRQN